MNKRTIAAIVFLLLCIAGIGHALYFYHCLPAQVAQHFGPSGQPDAWGSKMEFLIVYLGAIAVLAATFICAGVAISKVPDSAINLPNKDYWLAPERRQQTLDHMYSYLLWFGSLTTVFLIDVFHQAFKVQLGKTTKLDHIWVSLEVFLTVTAVWCIALFRKFRKTESQPPPYSASRGGSPQG